ncbi:uncharacterized protein LOC118182708 isoform X2 [Stegodyphus dumicola]|uniref:uncharacterized protein LOC118182708 isoform X2 n=1 Tax=Stegodyphus dumicola TaxID=202533 RepID=UPI0015AEA64F|nr:uncharacterized protein LOC118182708 isoform X2 [Stegodyphus dumicola]
MSVGLKVLTMKLLRHVFVLAILFFVTVTSLPRFDLDYYNMEERDESLVCDENNLFEKREEQVVGCKSIGSRCQLDYECCGRNTRCTFSFGSDFQFCAESHIMT